MKKIKPRPSLVQEAVNEVPVDIHPHLSTWWSLTFHKLSWDEDVVERPDLIDVRGHFGLRFITSRYSSDHRPFYFYFYSRNFCGMYPRRFFDWNDFVKNSNQDPRWEFIKKCTNLSEETFKIAKENYGTVIPFSIDPVKYKELCGGDTRLNTAAEVRRAKTVKERRKEWVRINKSVQAGRDPLTGKEIDDDD